jgi:ubiquinone/menaquinone biosynthesis C-methylase UbiE
MKQHNGAIEAEQRTYFNLLADMGHTKHIGGIAATKRLVEIINPGPNEELLDVGCGVGIGVIYLAEQFGCRAVGIDMTPGMIMRARERAERHGVADQVDFRIADMHALPFADASFKAVMAESVLSFSDNKTGAVNELLRVVEQDGLIAFTEAIWVKPPPPDKADFMARAAGMPHGILSHEAWQDILAASDLDQVIAESYALTALEEAKNQYRRISVGDYLRTLVNFFQVIIRPHYRQVFRSAMSSVPKDYFAYIGYGIYGGKKR